MEAITRKPFQGVTNILRFNWHFYALSLITVLILSTLLLYTPSPARVIIATGMLIIFSTAFLSIVISYYIYDYSDLYKLEWLKFLNIGHGAKIVTINAGLDETSFLLEKKYPTAFLQIFDFYDPLLHTEVSIKRARKMYPPHPFTIHVDTKAVPLEKESIDLIFVLLSAHEIRNTMERIYFFRQLSAGLKSTGKIIVAEHLRDIPNFIAFTIGFLHFYSGPVWRSDFTSANLVIEKEYKVTPFITIFMLTKRNGVTS